MEEACEQTARRERDICSEVTYGRISAAHAGIAHTSTASVICRPPGPEGHEGRRGIHGGMQGPEALV